MREGFAEASAREQSAKEELTKTRKLLVEVQAKEAKLLEHAADWEECQPQMERFKASVDRLENDNAALLEYIQELTDARNAKEKEVADLKLEIERLAGAKAAIEAAQSAVAAKDTQLDQVYQQLKELRQEVVRVRGDRLEDVEKAESQFQTARERLQAQVNRLQSDKADLSARLHEERLRAAEFEQKLEGARQEARMELEAEAQSMRRALQTEFEVRTSAAEAQAVGMKEIVEAENKRLEKELSTVKERLAESQALVRQLKEEGESMQERKSLVEMRVRMLEEEMAGSAAATVQQLEAHDRLVAAEQEADALRQQLRSTQQEGQQALQAAEAELDEWKGKAKHEQDRYTEYEATVKMEQQEANRRVAVAEGQLDSLRDLLAAQQEEVADARRQMVSHVVSSFGSMAPITGREKALQDMIDDLHRRLQRTESDLARWISTNNLGDELEDAKATVRRQQEDNLKLLDKKAALQGRVEAAEAELEAVRGVVRDSGMCGEYGFLDAGAAAGVREMASKISNLQAYASQEFQRANSLEAELLEAKRQVSLETYRTSEEKGRLLQVAEAMRATGRSFCDGDMLEELRAALRELAAKQTELSTVDLRAQALEAELASSQQRVQEANGRADREIGKVMEELEKLGEEKAALEGRVGEAKGEAERLQSQIETLEATKRTAEEGSRGAQEGLAAANARLEESDRRLVALEMQLQQAKSLVEEREAEIKRLRRLLRPVAAVAASAMAATPAQAPSPRQHRYSLDAQSASSAAPVRVPRDTAAPATAASTASSSMQRYRQLASDGMRAGGRRGGATAASSSLRRGGGNPQDGPLRRRLLGRFQQDSSDEEDEEAGGRGSSAASAPPAPHSRLAPSPHGSAGGLSATERLRRARRGVS